MSRKIMRRLFVGIPLADTVRASLMRNMTLLAETIPGSTVRWVPEANLHLTLKFLGDVDGARLRPLGQGLSVHLSQWRAMQATLHAGVMLLPRVKRPRVVAAGVEGGESLLHLVEHLELWAEKEGFPREKRGFKPHITLGRVKNGSDPLPDLTGDRITPLALSLDGVCLYESRLTPKGAHYTVRHAVALLTRRLNA